MFLASLRLGVRLFFQTIDDPGNAVLDQRRVEVDKQAKPLVGQPQILFHHLIDGFQNRDLRVLVADLQKCAHPGCNCLATKNSKYCGTYCEGAAGRPSIACACGHPECSAPEKVTGS